MFLVFCDLKTSITSSAILTWSDNVVTLVLTAFSQCRVHCCLLLKVPFKHNITWVPVGGDILNKGLFWHIKHLMFALNLCRAVWLWWKKDTIRLTLPNTPDTRLRPGASCTTTSIDFLLKHGIRSNPENVVSTKYPGVWICALINCCFFFANIHTC